MPSAHDVHSPQLVQRLRPLLERCAEFRATRGACFDSVESARDFFADEIHRLEREIAQTGNPRWKELFREASFAVVALVDETARVDLPETGRAYWLSRELEQEFFHTIQAGTEFYQRTDALLKRALVDETEVRAIYFRALALGFRGEYSGEETYRALDKAKALLRSLDRDTGHLRLTPGAYDYVERGRDPRLGSRWAAGALLAIVGVVIVSVVLFFTKANDDFAKIRNGLDEISGARVATGGSR